MPKITNGDMIRSGNTLIRFHGITTEISSQRLELMYQLR